MENGCEALNNSKELLLRGYAGRHTNSGAAGRSRWKKRVSVGKNPNFELILLPAGVGTGGVPKTKTTFGFGRVTLPEGARCDRGRIRERTKLNLSGVSSAVEEATNRGVIGAVSWCSKWIGGEVFIRDIGFKSVT